MWWFSLLVDTIEHLLCRFKTIWWEMYMIDQEKKRGSGVSYNGLPKYFCVPHCAVVLLILVHHDVDLSFSCPRFLCFPLCFSAFLFGARCRWNQAAFAWGGRRRGEMVTWRQLVDQANENRRPSFLFFVKASTKVDV
jgi:hypothetical protein